MRAVIVLMVVVLGGIPRRQFHGPESASPARWRF